MIPEQPAMQNQDPMGQMQDGAMMSGQPQVDPAIQQITQFLQKSLQDGARPEELVMSLIQQEVDQQSIGQAFMMVGYEQEDIVTLFEQVEKMSQERSASPTEVNQNPQELARNQQMQERQQGPVETESIETEIEPMMGKSGIEIKPENKGKFTRWAKARGMAVQEAARKVLANKSRYPASVVKMANFARNSAGWKKEEGGETEEFTAHMMYKGNKAVKANDLATHYKLKADGYVHKDELKKAEEGDETETEKVKVTDEMISNATVTTSEDPEWIQRLVEQGETGDTNSTKNDYMKQFMTNMNTTIGEQNDTDGNNNISKVNNTISQGPLYISPNTYSKDGFSLGNAFNSLMRVGNNAFGNKDLDGDGRKDGYLRDFTGKMADEKVQKYLDADYNVNMDGVLSEENVNNASIAYKKFIFENPTADDQYDAVGNLVNKGLEDNNLPQVEVPQGTEEEYKDFIEKNTELLGETAKATYEALRKKLGFKLGGSLPRAQFSVPDSGAPFANPMEGPMQAPTEDATETLTFQDWVLQDPITRGSANAQQEYQAYVDGESASAEETEIPTVANSGAPTDWDKDGDGIPDMGIDIDMGDGTGVAGDFQSAYDKVVKPTVDADFGGIKGFAKRAYNSPITKSFEGISGGIIDLTANIANPWLEKGLADEVEKDNRSRIVADELFAVETDPFNSRGTNNINGGPKGSEADRTTGLYMNQGVVTSKMGGGTNNAGFKALPASVQHNILSNLAYGGSTGPEAYLANRDRVIKREMAEAKEGGETVSIDSTMLAKLIAAGAEIEML